MTASEECTFAGFDTGCASADSETVFVYAQGRLVEKKTTKVEGGNPKPVISFTYEYNERGLLTKQSQFDARGRLVLASAYRYDETGALNGRSTDTNRDGKAEIEETLKTKRDSAGRLLELRYERILPKVDLGKRTGQGVVSKVTTFSYDSAGRLAGAKSVSKLVELDTSKPLKKHGYALKWAEEVLSSSYQTDPGGAIRAIVFCRDPQDPNDCTTTTLTLARLGAGEKLHEQRPFESTTDELFGECHFEEASPLEIYTVSGSLPGAFRGAVDGFRFKMAFGSRSTSHTEVARNSGGADSAPRESEAESSPLASSKTCELAAECCERIIKRSSAGAAATAGCVALKRLPEASCVQPLAAYRQSAKLLDVTCP